VIRAGHPPAAPAASDAGRNQHVPGATPAAVMPGFRGTRKELAARPGVSERTLYRRLKEEGLS